MEALESSDVLSAAVRHSAQLRGFLMELRRRGGGSLVLKPDRIVVRLAEVLGAVRCSRAVCGPLAVPTGEVWMALTDQGRNAIGG